MKTIVVAVDFSDITSRLIEKAAEMAGCYKSRVYIIHIAPPDPDFVGLKIGPPQERRSRVSELKKEKKDLEQLATKLKELGAEAIPLLIQGATAELILKETQRLNADLLIMGTHGLGLALTVLLGSTSQQVVKHVMCPVLLVPCSWKRNPPEILGFLTRQLHTKRVKHNLTLTEFTDTTCEIPITDRHDKIRSSATNHLVR